MSNVALNKTATASTYMDPFTAGRAVDGNLTATNRWVGQQVPCTLTVDLGVQTWINRWVVKHMSTITGWNNPKYSMTSFSLQGCNDATITNTSYWATIDAVSGNTSSITDRSITPVSYRHFRVYVTNGLGGNPMVASIVELELYDVPPTSPYLSNLVISSGTLTPAFAKNTYAYTASVAYDTVNIAVTPTAEQASCYGANAVIKVNGIVVQSGVSSQAIPLIVGVNNISIEVTSAIGGLKQTYTIAVTRLNAPPIYLTNLVLGTGATFETPFSSQTMSYNVNVDYEISTFTITPTANDSTATITINGTTVASGSEYTATSPVAGTSGTITVVISAPGKAPSTYTLTAIRASNNYLSTLAITPPQFRLTPSFNYLTQSYTSSTTFGSIAISPVAADTAATINVTVNDTPVTTPNPKSISFPTKGTYTIKIIVTPVYGACKRTYSIVVTKS
jgi:hypothetical protein